MDIGEFQKRPFLCVHIAQVRFKNLRFCGYPIFTAFSKTSVFCGFFVRISLNTFTKNEGFSLCFGTKMKQCELGLSFTSCGLMTISK